MRLSSLSLSAFAVTLVIALLPASAQNNAGVVAFANSGSPQAQASFLHGLALLHNFEYRDAIDSFRAAEKIDPNFAMAYWGEAMSFNFPIWMQRFRNPALKALARLAPTAEGRLAKAPTEREKDYLRAVEILYGEGDKKDCDKRYAEAMEALSRKYPDDVDAAAFYALALLGTAEGVRDERVYMRAAGVLIPLFYKYPQHPGVVHYLIHACDDPVHAPLALPAARVYAGIAPESSHAQHMTSHIFLALGMWEDVVRANEAAAAVEDRRSAAEGSPPMHCGHYNYWLEYGYLETGQNEKAKALLEACRAEGSRPEQMEHAHDVVDPDNASFLSFLQMQSRYLIDTGDWHSEVAAATAPVKDLPIAQFDQAVSRGFVQVSTGDAASAHESLATMRGLLPQLGPIFDRAGAAPDDPTRRVPGIEEKELDAMILAAEGHLDEAIARAQQAATDEQTLPYAFGPPDPAKPSYELLGELLLKANRAQEAEAAYRQALLRAPNRTQTLNALRRIASQARAGTGASR